MWPCKNEGEDARLYAAVRRRATMRWLWGSTFPPARIRLDGRRNTRTANRCTPGYGDHYLRGRSVG
ncbi:MAG: hypothetical protein ACLR8Y_14165 [Alistipes indistinctus]